MIEEREDGERGEREGNVYYESTPECVQHRPSRMRPMRDQEGVVSRNEHVPGRKASSPSAKSVQ